MTRVKCLQCTWKKNSAITACREARWCHACTGAQCWRRLEFPGETSSSSDFQTTWPMVSVSVLDSCQLWNSYTGIPRASPGRTIRNTHWAMAEVFGFDGKKQLEQTKWLVSVAPGSKMVGLGFASRCRPTRRARDAPLPFVCGTRQTGSVIRHEGISETHVGSHACGEVHAQTMGASITAKRPQLDIPPVRKCHMRSELSRTTSCGSTQQIVALSTGESEYIPITKGAAHGLQVRP